MGPKFATTRRPTPPDEITTQAEPKSATKEGQTGASSGDHTQHLGGTLVMRRPGCPPLQFCGCRPASVAVGCLCISIFGSRGARLLPWMITSDGCGPPCSIKSVSTALAGSASVRSWQGCVACLSRLILIALLSETDSSRCGLLLTRSTRCEQSRGLLPGQPAMRLLTERSTASRNGSLRSWRTQQRSTASEAPACESPFASGRPARLPHDPPVTS